MAQMALPLGTDFGVLLEQFQGQTNQVVKVYALVGQQALMVACHHVGCRYIVASGLCQRLLSGEPLVFPQADLPLPLARYGRIGSTATVFEQAQHIVAV